ncbi:MAG: hypothetical protein P4L51_01635 [Puia sp.]|nr:hypothetical protein [Puia sp.]
MLNLLVTLACAFLFGEYGNRIFAVLFWFKIATLALVWYFTEQYKKEEFYYYLNLGVSKTFLWTTTLGFDLSLFLFGLIQVHKFFKPI